ncbi:MAG: carboxylating nicotinate-nucleotide diphosphorylase [Gammaproteobacteria bacterium]
MSAELPEDIYDCVQRALAEDVGSGDLTAQLIDAKQRAHGHVTTREPAVLCGRAWFDEVFHQLDARIEIAWHAEDGAHVSPGQLLCHLAGPARALLTGERTALNFLQLLSGTATRAQAYVEAARGTHAVILDTRKTLPGLRAAQKYAVRTGGATNHRLGLYDGILIKENHILAAGGVRAAVAAARAPRTGVPVEIEVEKLEQLRAAIQAGAIRVLLDNFDLTRLRAAVVQAAGRVKLEASGGIDLKQLRATAETGVDYISVGALTKHVRAVDLSLRFEFEAADPPAQISKSGSPRSSRSH